MDRPRGAHPALPTLKRGSRRCSESAIGWRSTAPSRRGSRIIALGAEPDAADSQLEGDLRRQLTVGRLISETPAKPESTEMPDPFPTHRGEGRKRRSHRPGMPGATDETQHGFMARLQHQLWLEGLAAKIV